jgi:N-acylglucosamine 2-epimerase
MATEATEPAEAVLRRWLDELGADLYGRTLPFWLRHSVDAVHGGFFNCLDEDGGVTETSKHVWLQGRQCWMLARVANSHTDAELEALAARWAPAAAPAPPARSKAAAAAPVPLTRAGLIGAARAGVQFLRDHAVRASDGHVYFCLAADGRPVAEQRKPFAATFLIMALNEVGRATGEPALQAEARELTERVLGWLATPGSLRPERLEGAPELLPLNVPMIVSRGRGGGALAAGTARNCALPCVGARRERRHYLIAT